MTTSKTIAGLIGPTLVAIAAGMLLNIGSLPTLAEQVSRDPALIFVSGILLFVAGLAIVRAHNRWTEEWPVLVTILGWLAILSGLARVIFPTGLAAIAGRNWPDDRRDHRRSLRPPGARRLSLVQGIST